MSLKSLYRTAASEPWPEGGQVDALLELRDVAKYFPASAGPVRAVDGVSLSLRRNEVVGLVGESGCGKSTVGRLLLQLINPTEGQIVYRGRDITGLSRRALKPLRRELQIIFQDPYSSLNPRMTVRRIVGEPLIIHGLARGAELEERVAETLRLVGLSAIYMDRYPHELSGGQRQRVGIARALIANPKVIVADEAVSALDVSIQAQILNLLADLREEFQLALLLISHDLSVVQHLCDRIAVMYLGRVVETAAADDLVMAPRHPYTEALLSAVPLPDPVAQRSRRRIVLKGDVPSPLAPPTGCHFHTRCPYRRDKCFSHVPPLRMLAQGRQVACHFSEEIFSDTRAATSPQPARAASSP